MESLADDLLVVVLANADHASCHLTRATCRRWRELQEHAAAIRVRTLTFPQDWKLRRVERAKTKWHRFDEEPDFDPDNPWTQWRTVCEANMLWYFTHPPRGQLWAEMYLEGTGDDFVVATTDNQGVKLFLRADSPQISLLSSYYGPEPVVTEDQGEASRWTVVETVSYQGRVYAARPECGFIRLKNSPRFLETHGSNAAIGFFNIGELTGNLDGHPQLENWDGPQLSAVDFRLRGDRVGMSPENLFNPPPTEYPYSSYIGKLRRG